MLTARIPVRTFACHAKRQAKPFQAPGPAVAVRVRHPEPRFCRRALRDPDRPGARGPWRRVGARSPQDESAEAPAAYLLAGALLNLEPALRDALVLELPLAPLCAEDCPGLCSECGIRLGDAGPEHGHADAGTDPSPDGTPVPETRKER